MAAFPWVIKVALRGENPDRNLEVLKIMLGESSEDYKWAVAQNKLPVALTSRLRQLCSVALHQSPFVDAGVALMIEERIRELETVYGACQRIFTSPIPPTYSRHLSRVLTTWLLVTPMSLIASGLPTITVALTTTLGAYILIGIDEVGMEIENAFALLPLQQLCGSAQNDIRDAFLTEMPKVGL
jgi:predicted membrane chloride channel (bestrophin family)